MDGLPLVPIGDAPDERAFTSAHDHYSPARPISIRKWPGRRRGDCRDRHRYVSAAAS